MAFDVRSKSSALGTGSAVTLIKPAGTIASDGMIAFITHGAGVLLTPATDWVIVASVFTVDSILRILQYNGDTTIAGPWNFTMSASTTYVATAMTITRDTAPNAQRPVVDVANSSVINATLSPVTTPAARPVFGGDLILSALTVGRGTTFSPPGGVTEQVDLNTGNTVSDKTLWVGSQANATTADTPTTPITVTNNNPNSLSAGELGALTVTVKSIPPPTSWNGNFETCDTSQYAFVQTAAPDRITMRSDGAAQGLFYARFKALDDDIYPLTPNFDPRAQLVSPRWLFTGTERWISWATRFPEDYPSIPPTGWLVFMQIHGPPYNGSPTIGFGTSGEYMNFERNVSYSFDTAWQAPLVRGVWQYFTMRVNLAADTTGFVELWLNGRQQVFLPNGGRRRLYMKTVEPDQLTGCELDPTLYRKKGMFESVTLDHDGVVFDANPPAGLVQGGALDAIPTTPGHWFGRVVS